MTAWILPPLASPGSVTAEAAARAAADTAHAELATAHSGTRRLAYAEHDANVTTTIVTPTDIAQLTLTDVDCDGSPVRLEFYCWAAQVNVANRNIAVALLVDGVIVQEGWHTSGIANEADPLNVIQPVVPAAGLHTFKVQTWLPSVTSSPTGTLPAAAGKTMWFEATRY